MRILAFLCTALAVLGLAVAQAAGLDQAEALLRDGHAQQARAVAEAAPALTPQDALRRDWLIAQSHLSEGAPRAALPVLERMVSAAPGVERFRLELARTLFLTGDDDRARLHFEQSLGGRLALSEIHAVHEYLAAMDQRRRWEAFAQGAFAPQSNAQRRSGLDSVRIGDVLDIPLDPVERGTGVLLGAGGTWLPVLGQDLRGRFHAETQAQLFGGDIADSFALRAEAGLLALRDHGVQFGAGATARLHLSDGDRVLQGAGVYDSWQGPVQPQTLLSLRAEAEHLRYRGTPALDGPRARVSGQLRHVVSPQLRLSFGAEAAAQRPTTAFQRTRAAGVSLGAERAFEGGLVAGGDLGLTQVRYGAEHPFFPGEGARRDTRLELTARALHRDWNMSGFAPMLEVGYERQHSTIPFFSYDNLRLNLGATRRF